jgi:hypothetical protein
VCVFSRLLPSGTYYLSGQDFNDFLLNGAEGSKQWAVGSKQWAVGSEQWAGSREKSR